VSIQRSIFTIALAPALLLGQLNSNTVTVTVWQNSSSQPDQAIFNVTVGSGMDKSLDDIVKSVASVGISAVDLVGISFPSAQIQWSFQLPVPVSSLKQTTASLAALQTAIAQSGGSLSFSLGGTQNSGTPQQSCDFAGLIANAQAQAQSSTAAAGSAVGRITGISGSTSQGMAKLLGDGDVWFGLLRRSGTAHHLDHGFALGESSPRPSCDCDHRAISR